jgi:NAD(P)-dependent dehydrogenase (short-subunit alcohol dehydrogenase family)
MRALPMGRVGQPDEIKGICLLLASPASSFVTGSVWTIDGGATALTQGGVPHYPDI